MPRMRVIGLDHLYLTVRDLAVSERFYDQVLVETLGFRKDRAPIGGDEHAHYYNAHYGISLRPARPGTPPHDAYAPGLHHVCLRVETDADVDRAVAALAAHGIAATPGARYPQYAPDYYATFFADPDGIRLELTNFRANRRARMFAWDPPPPPPIFDPAALAYLRSRPTGRLATVDLDGRPDVACADFSLDGDRLLVRAPDPSQRNVRAGNVRVAFVVDDVARGVHVSGRAAIVERELAVTPETYRTWGFAGG